VRYALDPDVRRTDGGRVLIGGAPLRVVRLTDAGARALDALAAGDERRADAFVARLVDAGILHPQPDAPVTFTAADVTVVVPVRDDDPAPAQRSAAGAADTVVIDDAHGEGPAAARNRGWRRARTPIVAFVDADIEAPPGWLDKLLAHFDNPLVGAVAPRVRSSGGVFSSYEAERSPLDRGPVPGPVRPGSRVPYVPAAALVVRRDALEQIDGFDEALHVGEDVDLVWRLHHAGWRVRYEPSVEVDHPSRATFGAWLRQRFRYGTSVAALADRHGAAVAPLGISGWSALAWGLVVAGRPVAGLATGAATTAALTPKLRALDHPAAEAVRIAGTGNLYAGRAVADALRRPWWPLAALLAWRVRRVRPAVLAAVVAPPWPGRFVGVRLLDDLAYGAGVWAGCLRARSGRALLPSFTGPFPPPRPADPVAH
jgi:mycofactocin glycosyltransferase